MAIRVLKTDPNGPPVPGYPDVKGTFEVTYDGAVLATGEYNGYSDSDFYADVWNDATGRVERITYATTRGWTYANSAGVDATPEVRAKAAAFYAKAALAALLDGAAAAARTPDKGKRVMVVKGRKVPKGVVGEVFWVGEGRYFGPVPKYRNGWSTAAPKRLGIRGDDGETYWTSASNVEVLDAEEYLTADYEELVKKAEGIGADKAWVGYGRAA